MNVTLPPELQKMVDEHIHSGRFASSAEVIREGLLLLAQHERDAEARLESLRRDIAIGIDQSDRGESAALDMEAVRTEGRRLLSELSASER